MTSHLILLLTEPYLLSIPYTVVAEWTPTFIKVTGKGVVGVG